MFFFFFFMEALLTEREKKNLVLAVVVTGEHSHHSSWPHAIESSLPDPVYPLVWHNCTFPVVWLLLDLYLALLLQVLSDTEDEESLRRGVFVFSHPCEPVALWRARSNTAADWQSGDHSTSRQNQWWSTLIRLIGSLAPTWKTNHKSGNFFSRFFSFFSWIPLVHVQKKSSTLDLVACSSVLWHSASVWALCHNPLFVLTFTSLRRGIIYDLGQV